MVSALMVSALVSGASGPGSSPGRGHFSLTVSLSTQMYKWVPANLMLGVTLRWTSRNRDKLATGPYADFTKARQ